MEGRDDVMRWDWVVRLLGYWDAMRWSIPSGLDDDVCRVGKNIKTVAHEAQARQFIGESTRYKVNSTN